MSSSPSPLIDMARDIHERFTKFMGMIPGHSETPSAHDQAVQDMTKQANDKAANDATASFAAAAAKMKSEGHTYDSNRPQVQVRSRYSK